MAILKKSTIDKAQRILREESREITLLLGNGFNRAYKSREAQSWKKLMIDLIDWITRNHPHFDDATDVSLKRLHKLTQINDGYASLPEIFDLLEATHTIKYSKTSKYGLEFSMQAEVKRLLGGLTPGKAHRAVVNWALNKKVPILTTNYDHCFEKAASPETVLKPKFYPKILRLPCAKRRSDYYPWDRYYAPENIDSIDIGFGIWHIHGDQNYTRSIRAGIDHYMGMVQRLRPLKGAVAREALESHHSVENIDPIHNQAPWLKILFGRKVWIQGLALDAGEVSLRWLLIQRFIYWNQFKSISSQPCAWYVHGPTEAKNVGPLEAKRRWFLESIGAEVLEFRTNEEMHERLFCIS